MKHTLFLKIFSLALFFSAGKMANASAISLKPSADSLSLIIKPFGHPKHTIVKLNPNPTFDGKINITSSADEELHFYVFDLEGTLMNRITLQGKTKILLPNLRKGTYTYDVFKNDESIEQGEIIVK